MNHPRIIADVTGPQDPSSFNETVFNQTVQTASELLASAANSITGQEMRQNEQLARMMGDPSGKDFTFTMIDEVFRSHDRTVQADRLRRLIHEFGVPAYFSLLDRMLISVASSMSKFLPKQIMPFIEKRMRSDTAQVVLPGEWEELRQYLDQRHEQSFSINLNHLGEAVLGEDEASHRLATVLEYLSKDEVRYISVKISAIFSQINLIAWDDTLGAIKERLRTLYRAALPNRKFVNLDMEEYRDLELTLAAFCGVLDEPEFSDLPAGIVLQAYLPDSWDAQRRVTKWAQSRLQSGGAQIKVRLVKGANLAMESVEAELNGWTAAPYATKHETDSNFRRMLEFGCRPDNVKAVRLGVASHNLFDVALALSLREINGVSNHIEIEMLEGMANHQARSVRDRADGLLLYAPAVKRADFLSAMAYLVRRLAENTAPDNYLHDLFRIAPGSTEWKAQQRRFEQGWNNRLEVSSDSRRAQLLTPPDSSEFWNEPNSDWTQTETRTCYEKAIQSYEPCSRPELESLDEVMSRAELGLSSWQGCSIEDRADVLRAAADVMSRERFTTVACMRGEAKKAAIEADVEISEAIDFARYYANTFRVPDGMRAAPVGVVVIASPWNFPYAIPCGGVLAALIACNAVILKPAPETVEVAWLLAQQLWEAGVPQDVLQFYPCADGEVGKALITDPRVACVVLTGAYETARMFQDWRPSLRLLAETSGKNAIVVTSQSDRELAVKDIVKSAFAHAGQKCSAGSLAILEAEVYDDPGFIKQLCDAAKSFTCGPACDARNIVTPIIHPPDGPLLKALTTLESGESWLLKPEQVGDDPSCWSPGIRLGVQPGSWFHTTECFGPVLGLMKAQNLAEAVKWQNATDFGLTAGLHSLDRSEQSYWKDHVAAGNLYINRPITGAVVRRQPFGGWKKSCIGPGAKAGGPNYVYQFAQMTEDSACEWEASYRKAWLGYSSDHDPSGLVSESNVFRYRPSRGVIVRLPASDSDLQRRLELASELTGVPYELSCADSESDADFAARLLHSGGRFEFLRTVETPDDQVLRAAYRVEMNWIDAAVTSHGEFELRHWLREQSISTTLHRYGQMLETARS